MPGVAAIANLYNTPNYVGELFALTPTDTPFLSAIGGLTSGRRATGTLHTCRLGCQQPRRRSAVGGQRRLEGHPPQRLLSPKGRGKSMLVRRVDVISSR